MFEKGGGCEMVCEGVVLCLHEEVRHSGFTRFNDKEIVTVCISAFLSVRLI